MNKKAYVIHLFNRRRDNAIKRHPMKNTCATDIVLFNLY